VTLGLRPRSGGQRFVDEGQNFRNYTYAQFGRAILQQPGNFAWQIFDRKVEHLLYDEYRFKHATFVEADTLEDLTSKMQDVDAPPFRAYPVTCGITFTYLGLRIDMSAAVLDESGTRIPGLFACGEMVGGLFFDGYPGGSGLTSGAVFGRLAGRSAALSQL